MDLRWVTSHLAPAGIDDDRALRDAALRRGLQAECAVWDDPAVDWSRGRLAVIRTPWDYFQRVATFLEWAERTHRVTRLVHAPAILAWNAHKRYLTELQENDVPVVPTLEVSTPDRATFDRFVAEVGDALVVKPAVSGGAHGTLRFDHPSPAWEHARGLLANGDVLVQPFVPIEGGETSLIWIDGEVTHAVCKRPAPGDFRVQTEYGGTVEAVDPQPNDLRLADLAIRAATERVQAPLTYARVDVVNTPSGPVLMELELIEPELFFRVHPGAADRLVEALVGTT